MSSDYVIQRCAQDADFEAVLWAHPPCGYSETMPIHPHSEADAIQQEFFRRMKPSERLGLALEMSDSLRRVALDGLRSRRPELSEEELSSELMRLMYGSVAQP